MPDWDQSSPRNRLLNPIPCTPRAESRPRLDWMTTSRNITPTPSQRAQGSVIRQPCAFWLNRVRQKSNACCVGERILNEKEMHYLFPVREGMVSRALCMAMED